MRVGQGGNQAAVPIHAVGGNGILCGAEIGRQAVHRRIQREAGRKAAAAHGKPLHTLERVRHIAANLHDAAHIAVGHADGAILAMEGRRLS